MCLRRRLIMRANRNLPRKRCRKYRIKNQTPSDCCSTRIKRRIIIIVVIHYLYRPVVARLSIRFRVKMLPDFVKIIQRGDRRGFLFILFFFYFRPRACTLRSFSFRAIKTVPFYRMYIPDTFCNILLLP